MSTSSRRSLLPNRNLNSVKSMDLDRRQSRASSRSRRVDVSHEDAFSYALRVAYLHYLSQPRQKRRKFVPAATKRHSTIAVTDMMNELKGRDSRSFKLPHSFQKDLEKRLKGAISGQERLSGFNEAAVKRSMANAYNSFTESDFRRSASKDRKIEQYILVFYARATAAFSAAERDANDYKTKLDRHVVLFVRLVISILKDHGGDRAELINALQSLENKLHSHTQALYIDNTSSSEGTYVEEDIPLTYDVKDMRMVQDVARIFGRAISDVQVVINENKAAWTEEEAVKDIKTYLSLLRTNAPGTLSSRDFDLDEAFNDWKKVEVASVTKLLLEHLQAKPELNKTNTDDNTPLPLRPTSLYGAEQAYADLGRAVQGHDSGDPYGLDMMSPSLGGMSLDEASSIRMVDDAKAEDQAAVAFSFIPPHPRDYYKVIVQYAMTYDLLHAEGPSDDFKPLSESSLALLTELCTRWRVPQFSRLVVLLEVAAGKFLDGEITDVTELGQTFDFVKEDAETSKKPPHLPQYNKGLASIAPSLWTMHDYASYRQTLQSIHAALQRELYQVLVQTYRAKKAPSHKVICLVLEEHIYGNPAFSQREDDKLAFTEQLKQGLRHAAMESYASMLESHVPEEQANWDFVHVVKLGKAVVGLCKTLKKRFSKTPEILGANPYRIFIETVFPNFENDAHDLIERIFVVSADSGVDIPVEEAFCLYHELNEIHDHHREVLPNRPFEFDIEELLVQFVWKYLATAESKTEFFVKEAIKSDNFEVRSRPGEEPSDNERHSLSVIDVFRFFHQTKEGLLSLDWRNAYHVAKFRTIIARIYATGIGKYCEEVEAMFSKEMDRPTAQEMAARQQGSGLMKMAKDALATKEKPEPFQFYEQSFVKLNNIEYAMQELDKLESVMEVEQCVKVIEGRDGPLQRSTRAPSKYVFTVKIVEAEDLKACDPSGYSDPYVVLCDEFQKRLYKTRIISRNLNPQWNESVDITVTQPLNIIATIWDWDTFGDHDFVGRTSLKLDPKHFSDYLPREFWLDLDTQGKILIRASMEGERDDIQFHFGKAFRCLKRAERDMVRKITDKLVAEINATISLDTLRQLLNRGIGASISSLWNKRTSAPPSVTEAEMATVLRPLLEYFENNFSIMNQTLTHDTMQAVMSRLWKEVLIAIETLLVPPLSDKPSSQRPLGQKELDIVFYWKEQLYHFFLARNPTTGVAEGVPETILKSPKWHDLGTAYFFYNEPTSTLIRESERMASATQQRHQAAISGSPGNRHTAPATLMVPGVHAGGAASSASHHVPAAVGGAFASMGTIRRGKSIAMSRNLGTIRRAKEEKRKEAQAEPSDDMILRILRMRPDAAGYLRERARQKERMQAVSTAAMIVRNSVFQGINVAGSPSGRGSLPRR